MPASQHREYDVLPTSLYQSSTSVPGKFSAIPNAAQLQQKPSTPNPFLAAQQKRQYAVRYAPKTFASADGGTVTGYTPSNGPYVGEYLSMDDERVTKSVLQYYHTKDGQMVCVAHGRYYMPNKRAFSNVSGWHTITIDEKMNHGQSINFLDGSTISVVGNYLHTGNDVSDDIAKNVAGVDKRGSSYMFNINELVHYNDEIDTFEPSDEYLVADPRVYEEAVCRSEFEELRMVETPNCTREEFFDYPRDHIVQLSAPVHIRQQAMAKLTRRRLHSLCRHYADLLESKVL
jgi:hypothetical protein